jgi:molybdenum cofactor cytidylyltransferase
LPLAVLVLAAGAGSRYSSRPGAKLLADLDGQPVLAHVLESVRTFRPSATLVVLGHGARDIERTIRWSGESRIINRTPDRGLASSLQVGFHALASLPGEFDGALVVLGDQPRLRPEVMRMLAETARRANEGCRGPLLVPRYEGEPGPRNPVLLLRAAWDWVEDLSGDRGLAMLIDSRPDLVLEVPVPGTMPDVDEPADLERLSARPA